MNKGKILILFIYNILKHLGGLKVQLVAQYNMIFIIAITLTLEPINCDEKDMYMTLYQCMDRGILLR